MNKDQRAKVIVRSGGGERTFYEAADNFVWMYNQLGCRFRNISTGRMVELKCPTIIVEEL